MPQLCETSQSQYWHQRHCHDPDTKRDGVAEQIRQVQYSTSFSDYSGITNLRESGFEDPTLICYVMERNIILLL